MPSLSHGIQRRTSECGCGKQGLNRRRGIPGQAGAGGAERAGNANGQRGALAAAGLTGIALPAKAVRYFLGSPTPSRDGGTGRRSGLKIRRPLRSWGFDPPSRHQLTDFIINNLRGRSISCPCSARIECCLIGAHLHSGNPSDTGPIQSRLMASVNRKVVAELTVGELTVSQADIAFCRIMARWHGGRST